MKLPIEKINRRESLGYWLNEQNLLGAGAEIGCAYGWFARTVTSVWKGKQYYMVDPWVKQDTKVYREDTSKVDYNIWFRDCQKLAQEDKRITLVREFSVEAAKAFEPESLDFVYIDGNHSYGACLEDMDAWYPKVKHGGLFSGHDCYNDTNFPNFCEVEQAVQRWANEHNCSFMVTPCSSWWIAKE